MKKYLLIFLMSVALCAQADDNVLHKIEESDSASIFACSNFLRVNVNDPDLKTMPLRDDDMQVVNELLANKTVIKGKQEQQINKASAGLVIQVDRNGLDPKTIYICDSYWHIPGEISYYVIPQDIRNKVKEMTDYYKDRCLQKQHITKYDHLPMCSHVMGRMHKNIMIYDFYVLESSGNILRINYCLQKTNDSVLVQRSVEPYIFGKYLRTNEDGMFVFRENDGSIWTIPKQSELRHEYTIKMIPEWEGKTDQERMRILDSYLEK
ncbi:MAG: hypothetical protein KBT06_05035 [Prevotellaceae bacterium]|nr:hypothetical protein [Candidatus Colivivens equi]